MCCSARRKIQAEHDVKALSWLVEQKNMALDHMHSLADDFSHCDKRCCTAIGKALDLTTKDYPG